MREKRNSNWRGGRLTTQTRRTASYRRKVGAHQPNQSTDTQLFHSGAIAIRPCTREGFVDGNLKSTDRTDRPAGNRGRSLCSRAIATIPAHNKACDITDGGLASTHRTDRPTDRPARGRCVCTQGRKIPYPNTRSLLLTEALASTHLQTDRLATRGSRVNSHARHHPCT